MNASLDETTDTGLAGGVVSRQAIDDWARALIAAGHTVIAPQSTGQGAGEYRILSASSPSADALGKGLPRMSPKGAYFPRSEVILRVHREGKQWSIQDPENGFPSIVILGARPCDAAAPEILAPLFGWDFHDRFFEERIKKISFIVVACTAPVDNACFCTSLGIDPAGENMGDILLTPLASGDFHAQVRSEKGRELFSSLPAAASSAPPADDLHAIRERARKAVAPRFSPETVQQSLAKKFDDPMWKESAQSCLGCGTCAYACPTCHCFDIQDEMSGRDGIRQKNWDACQFPLFTLHTSGHNPRHDQASRWRQRLNHKFRYYPEKFGKILCTGCGRCIRLCPGGMDLLADLTRLGEGEAPSEPTERRVGVLAHDVVVVPAKAVGEYAHPTTTTADQSAIDNIYRPYLMRVADLRDETPDVRTLRLEFANPADGENFQFDVGQFGLYSALGEGESTFCIASSPTRKGYIECTFRQAGRVTRALRRLGVGDLMGFRGPYGNRFPLEQWKGKDILFVAGGIALPPMRCVIQYCLDNRADFGDVTIVYGARTSSDLVYKHELAEWDDRRDVRLWQCIDWRPAPDGKGLAEAPAEEGWYPLNMKDPGASQLDPSQSKYTGFVPQMVEAARPSPENRIAVVCGPPIMIKFTLQSLKKLGFSSEQVYTTLENRMKCGLGKCGRCNVGSTYVCKEGPVFTAMEVEKMPASEM